MAAAETAHRKSTFQNGFITADAGRNLRPIENWFPTNRGAHLLALAQEICAAIDSGRYFDSMLLGGGQSIEIVPVAG